MTTDFCHYCLVAAVHIERVIISENNAAEKYSDTLLQPFNTFVTAVTPATTASTRNFSNGTWK